MHTERELRPGSGCMPPKLDMARRRDRQATKDARLLGGQDMGEPLQNDELMEHAAGRDAGGPGTADSSTQFETCRRVEALGRRKAARSSASCC